MRTSMMIATLLAVSLSACLDDPNDDANDAPEVEGEAPFTHWERLSDIAFVRADEATKYDDPCALLPAEGLCSHACDPNLDGLIPAGTCASFSCTLRDGRVIVAGGCASTEP